jgi:glycosyltransferase involved in cell wall biosynthesis
MKVAIIHYHLRRGGVTRVIEAQSQTLRRAGIDHVILSGTPRDGRVNLPVEVVRELGYGPSHRALDGHALDATLRAAARRTLGRAPDLWHIHNPTLGKNTLFPNLVAELARTHQRLVLQTHDFAEDGRPANYRTISEERLLYPLAPQIRYATINSRDRPLLVEAGIPQDQVTLLPNAVLPARILPRPVDPDLPATVLYPVRGIRRKNLGEFCLLSALAPPDVQFALTLAPENPEWQPIFNRWAGFAAQHELPARFGVVNNTPPVPGLDPTYENWLAHATHIVTTSVAEGFGLAFLEPIELRKPLLGRDLPEITTDFRSHGLDLGDLYDDLLIPSEWIDDRDLFDSLQRSLEEIYGAYRLPLTDELAREALETLSLGDYLDFGNLPEELQLVALTRALRFREEVMVGRDGCCIPASNWLASALAATAPRSDPALLDRYSLTRYADRLQTIYQDLAGVTPAAPVWLDKSKILHQFLNPARFHFLRS